MTEYLPTIKRVWWNRKTDAVLSFYFFFLFILAPSASGQSIAGSYQRYVNQLTTENYTFNGDGSFAFSRVTLASEAISGEGTYNLQADSLVLIYPDPSPDDIGTYEVSTTVSDPEYCGQELKIVVRDASSSRGGFRHFSFVFVEKPEPLSVMSRYSNAESPSQVFHFSCDLQPISVKVGTYGTESLNIDLSEYLNSKYELDVLLRKRIDMTGHSIEMPSGIQGFRIRIDKKTGDLRLLRSHSVMLLHPSGEAK